MGYPTSDRAGECSFPTNWHLCTRVLVNGVPCPSGHLFTLKSKLQTGGKIILSDSFPRWQWGSSMMSLFNVTPIPTCLSWGYSFHTLVGRSLGLYLKWTKDLNVSPSFVSFNTLLGQWCHQGSCVLILAGSQLSHVRTCMIQNIVNFCCLS